MILFIILGLGAALARADDRHLRGGHLTIASR